MHIRPTTEPQNTWCKNWWNSTHVYLLSVLFRFENTCQVFYIQEVLTESFKSLSKDGVRIRVASILWSNNLSQPRWQCCSQIKSTSINNSMRHRSKLRPKEIKSFTKITQKSYAISFLFILLPAVLPSYEASHENQVKKDTIQSALCGTWNSLISLIYSLTVLPVKKAHTCCF